MEFSGGIPFESLPPEIQEMLRAQYEEHKKQHDLMHMGIESSRHRLLNWFESLDEEGLLCLRTMITLVAQDDDNAGSYYMGLTAQMLNQFGYCKICHVKHETVEGVDLHATAEKPEPAVTKTSILQGEGRIMDLMVEYQVKPTGVGDQVECINCGYTNVSLQDRMLREPGVEGCQGCIHKNKWG